MDIINFIENFTSQLDVQPEQPIQSDTNFRELESWDSLTALSIIAMVDDEYGVTINGEDIRKSNTISDLFSIIEVKKSA